MCETFSLSYRARMKNRPKPDPVNHSAHYTAGKLEVIDAIEGLDLGFHAGNVVKYVARYKLKGGVQDLQKAKWYLERLIANLNQ